MWIVCDFISNSYDCILISSDFIWMSCDFSWISCDFLWISCDLYGSHLILHGFVEQHDDGHAAVTAILFSQREGYNVFIIAPVMMSDS